MSENLKKVISWVVLLVFFLASILLSPDTNAKFLLALLAVYVLFSYGRTIWRNWEK